MSINPAGFAIHVAVRKALPHVVAACHCYSKPTKAISAFGCRLEPINQDEFRFYGGHAIYEGFGGIVLREERRHIVKGLGRNKAVILANLGILDWCKDSRCSDIPLRGNGQVYSGPVACRCSSG